VKKWPKNSYGEFFAGDSYIVLKVTMGKDKDGSPKLHRDIHFWLGKSTSIDEQGTAAIKTVELDDFFDGEPIQHREVMNHESKQFLSYWGHPPVFMEGGVESGFRHVTPTEFRCRLLRVHGKKKKVKATEVPLTAASLNDGDTFILDNGLTLFQWQGTNAGIWEKQQARDVAISIDDSRAGRAKVKVLDQDGHADIDDGKFWKLIGGKKPIKEARDEEALNINTPTVLWRLSDATGHLETVEVARDMGEHGGACHKGLLKSDDVFFLWSPKEETFFAWVGSKASDTERRNALFLAEKVLRKHGLHQATPVQRVREGYEPPSFWNAL